MNPVTTPRCKLLRKPAPSITTCIDSQSSRELRARRPSASRSSPEGLGASAGTIARGTHLVPRPTRSPLLPPHNPAAAGSHGPLPPAAQTHPPPPAMLSASFYRSLHL